MIDFTKFNLDTIGPRQKTLTAITDNNNHNRRLLEICMRYWQSLDDFRERAYRNHLYYRGDQWHETMTHPDTGETVTEESYIRSTGRIPLKQNIIRIMVKNVLGQFRTNKTKSMVISRAKEGATESEMLTNSLNAVHDVNHARELDVRDMEKFLLSGFAGSHIRYSHFKSRNTEDVKLKPVNLYHFFCNTDLTDIRMEELRLIGQFYDEDPDNVIAQFARNAQHAKNIREGYGATDRDSISTAYGLDSSRTRNVNFLFPLEQTKWRVYEVWELRAKWRLYVHDYATGQYRIETGRTYQQLMDENARRIKMAAEVGIPADKVPLMEVTQKYDQYWYGQFLTPMGNVLWEGETPYDHGEHPFVILLYPLTNGEVWGFVEDIIDQQRYINRLISMIDFIIGNSAKGVLLAPEGSVPDTEDPNTWAAKWSRFDGVIMYKHKPGIPPPQQVTSNSVNIGANELLALQLKLMNEISGVHGAIQGKQATSGTPASLYAQEAQNATLNTLDMMETFNWYRQRRDYKALKTAIQFYKKRHLIISGSDYNSQVHEYDPEKAKNLEWELTLSQSLESPVYRQIVDGLLYDLLNSKAIDIEMFLENTSAPFAEKMLAQIRSRREEMQKMGQADMSVIRQMLPEAEQQATAAANPKAMQMIEMGK